MGIFRAVAILMLLTSIVHARPVSWPDGWTVMQKNNHIETRVHTHFSPNAFNSVGMVYRNGHESDSEYVGVQWNHLLKRRNTRFSQANVYLRAGIGREEVSGDRSTLGSIGVAADWETRRWFTSYSATYEDGDDNKDRVDFEQFARFGVAPYVAEYGNLHTWLMLQVHHRPAVDNEIVVTPLVRLFHGNYLAEAGISDDGDALFNWIVRF